MIDEAALYAEHPWLDPAEWRDRECYVVGCGASIIGTDWSVLAGKNTIAVNEAVGEFESTIAFSFDPLFDKRTRGGWFGPRVKKNWEKHEGKIVLKPGKGYRKPRGATSGLGGMELALCLGANPIYLVGMDYRIGSIGGGSAVISDLDFKHALAPAVERFAHETDSVGRFINLNDRSRLKCFATRPPLPKLNGRSLSTRVDAMTFDLLRENLAPGAWRGRRCFVVGCGPSVLAFDWSRLECEKTIGVNGALQHFKPSVAFTMDSLFDQNAREGKYGPEMMAQWGLHPCKLFKHSRDKEPTGASSGMGAIQLALYLGASPIYLLGFDFGHVEEMGLTSSHCIENYPVCPKEKYENVLIPAMNAFAKRILNGKQTGWGEEPHVPPKIINLNPHSNLKCFEFGEFPT